MGNKAVTLATNVLYNSWISDVMTCHKAMRTELFRSLKLRERGLRDRAGDRRAGAAAPASGSTRCRSRYQARSREEGKKLTALDGLRVLRTLCAAGSTRAASR